MSSILIAPYNDSMRLGQGYNSFLHRPCILNAVKFTEPKKDNPIAKHHDSTSQVVDYSSRFVDKISEVAKSMNVSAGSSIKNGGIVGSGSSVTLDEAKFTESDLNAVVSVKVINQTTELLSDATFEDPGIPFTNEDFFATYGNSYISGFIEGGELIGVVSVKVMDVQNKAEVKRAIKGFVNSSGVQSEFFLDENASSKGSRATMDKTETTITVSWSGGGQIKPENQGWTLDSLYSAASAFPANVARCPQKTWAILTPYYHSKSFLAWSKTKSIKVPQFEGALVYANVLLDMFMEYKTLVGRIQAVLSNPVDYIATQAENPIRVNIGELLEVRRVLSMQMKKITKTVDLISRNPEEVETIEGEASIQEPELWSTRIPVHRPDEENSDEWTTAQAAELLSNFSFSPGSLMEKAPAKEDQLANGQLLQENVYPLIELPDHNLSLMEDEKNAFCTEEAREKFKDFWIGLPVGGAAGDFFNGAPGLLHMEQRYPTNFGFHMVRHSHADIILLGWIRTSYGGSFTIHGERDDPVETVILDLGPEERVVRVRMSKHKVATSELVGIAFIELTTSAGQKVSIGSSKGLRIVDSTMPAKQSQGLKGCNRALRPFSIRSLFADRLDDVSPAEEGQRSTVKDYTLYTKATKANRDRAEYLIKTYITTGVGQVAQHRALNLSNYMTRNVRVIKPDELDRLLGAEQLFGRLAEFGIVDLRDTTNDYSRKIRGAFDMPLHDSHSVSALRPTNNFQLQAVNPPD
ncbi:hypothetical protein NM208_g9089 [Fusarium decemcellulare]|uniref:Uncharacterized protein n=1 Tax=Fusarium decemcellulare TaxID=57161 RepID=A0ACC1S2X1_9HYPO|nr:hypothetical protein NM208_g9089 [Fusarium decemcellulare]